MEQTIYELFEALNPYQKALFIDARLSWASNGGLCGELQKRICTPVSEN